MVKICKRILQLRIRDVKNIREEDVSAGGYILLSFGFLSQNLLGSWTGVLRLSGALIVRPRLTVNADTVLFHKDFFGTAVNHLDEDTVDRFGDFHSLKVEITYVFF